MSCFVSILGLVCFGLVLSLEFVLTFQLHLVCLQILVVVKYEVDNDYLGYSCINYEVAYS